MQEKLKYFVDDNLYDRLAYWQTREDLVSTVYIYLDQSNNHTYALAETDYIGSYEDDRGCAKGFTNFYTDFKGFFEIFDLEVKNVIRPLLPS